MSEARLVVRVPVCQVPRGRKPEEVRGEILERLKASPRCVGYSVDLEIGGYVPHIATSDTRRGTFAAIAAACECVAAACEEFDF